MNTENIYECYDRISNIEKERDDLISSLHDLEQRCESSSDFVVVIME